MSLPKYISHPDCSSVESLNKHDAKLQVALAIAWEALETIIANPVAACSDRHDVVIQEAMRRIEALGKDPQ